MTYPNRQRETLMLDALRDMIPNPVFKACIEPWEFEVLTKAPVMFKYSFSYDEQSGQVEFYTHDGAQLARDLATVIDAGETSWTEILH